MESSRCIGGIDKFRYVRLSGMLVSQTLLQRMGGQAGNEQQRREKRNRHDRITRHVAFFGLIAVLNLWKLTD